MAKPIKAKIRLVIPAGSATPAPPVSSSLGPHGVKLMDFCKAFNAETAGRKGETVPIVVTVYTDRTFDFITKKPPVSELIRNKAKIKKGSSQPGKDIVGQISISAIEEIAKVKMPDFNTTDLEAAKKIVAGSARSMGLVVVD